MLEFRGVSKAYNGATPDGLAALGYDAAMVAVGRILAGRVE